VTGSAGAHGATGASAGSGAMLFWIDVDAALQREADAWYADEHLPDRVSVAGYRSARRYIAIDAAPRYLSVFEADTPQALASEGYLKLVGNVDERSRRIRAGFRGVVRNAFEVRAGHGRGRGGVLASVRLDVRHDPASGVAADALAAHAAMRALVDALDGEHGVVGACWLAAAPAVRARIDGARVTGKDDATVPHALIVEATHVDALHALRQGALSQEMLARAGWAESAYGTHALMVAFP